MPSHRLQILETQTNGSREALLTWLLTWPARVHHDVVLIRVRVMVPAVRVVACLSRLHSHFSVMINMCKVFRTSPLPTPIAGI